MVGTTSYTNFSNSSIVKLARVLNTPNVVQVVAKTSCTPILRLINCIFLPPIMLIFPRITQVIATCITIQSFATISSSNSLSLVGEFKLKFDKNILHRWQVEWDRIKKNEMGLPKTLKKIQVTWHSQGTRL